MADMTLAQLRAVRERYIKRELKTIGGTLFLGIPDRWFDKPGPKYRCLNNHVSTFILRSETGNRCLDCQEYLIMTFPEDEDGWLNDQIPIPGDSEELVRVEPCADLLKSTITASLQFLV